MTSVPGGCTSVPTSSSGSGSGSASVQSALVGCASASSSGLYAACLSGCGDVVSAPL